MYTYRVHTPIIQYLHYSARLSLLNRWVRFGTDLELLDSPGILPMRISDQTAAIKLAICDDIGERSYDFADVVAILVQMLIRHPAIGQLSDKLMITILYLKLMFHESVSFLESNICML